MKIKYFVIVIACLLLLTVASAQGYSIRANRGLNLRAAPSLNANIAETVRSGAILHVGGQFGHWLKINRGGNEVWLADWVDYSRVDQTPTQTAASSPIDNCCFVDRQCNSDQEWTDGYWAFQNGQCAAPAQPQTGTPAQPAASGTDPIDNCCFAGWACHSDRDWVNGYWAYQNGQCAGPAQSQPAGASGPIDNCCQAGWICHSELEWVSGYYSYQNNECDSATRTGNASSCCQLGWNCTVGLDHWLGEKVVREGFVCDMPVRVAYGRTVLVGSEAFISQVTAALEYLKSRVPHWYAYIVNAIAKIRGGPFGPGTFALGGSINIAPPHAQEGAIVLAGTLLHEACHVNRDNDGSDETTHPYNNVEGFSIEENICETLREGALTEANPSRPPNPWLSDAIAFFRRHGGNYDFQAAANAQRDRAFWLLSQGI